MALMHLLPLFFFFLLFLHVPHATSTSLPAATIRMRRSSLNTTLSCKESCVADGLGNSLVQQSCDDGDFDNLCNPSRCICPTTTRKVTISCASKTCLSNFKRKRANVKFSSVNPDFVWILTYTIRGTIFDKGTKKAGSCKVLVKGSYRPRTKDLVVTRKKAKAVIDAVLEAIFAVGQGKKAACVGLIKKAVQKATDDTLTMEDMEEEEPETGVLPPTMTGVGTSPN